MIERSFDTVAGWLDRHHPEVTPHFNPPVSYDQIAAAEARFGQALPPQVRSLYLLANGQPYDGVGLEGSFTIMSLDEAVGTFDFLNTEFPDGTNSDASEEAVVEADTGVRAVWWSRRWIPVMQNGGGDYLCIDLDPAGDGTVGQIVSFYHDEMFRSLVANGMGEMLEALARRMAAGRCRVEDGMIEDV